jgi:hypothetical protein
MHLARAILYGTRLLFAWNLAAQDDDKPKDAEECKDSPLITSLLADDKMKHVEGEYHYWDNGTREAQ